MKHNVLKLDDVNLSKFSFDLEKNIASVDIINMENGGDICTITISGINSLNYNDNLNEPEVLPAYVGEVNIYKEDDHRYILKMVGWLDLSLVGKSCEVFYPNEDTPEK